MTKRFIVLLDGATDEKDNKFLSYVKDHNLAWWHWLSNSWLLIDYNDILSTEEIRDRLRQIYGDAVNNLVIELKQQGTWHGLGPGSGDRNMYEWLQDNWDKV